MRWREVDMFRMKDFESPLLLKFRGRCWSIDHMTNRAEVAKVFVIATMCVD